MSGEKLVFARALNGNDSGVYECNVKNPLGEGKAEYLLTISGRKCFIKKIKKRFCSLLKTGKLDAALQC